MTVRFVLAALAAIALSTTALAQTKTAPQVQTAPQLKTSPQLQTVPKLKLVTPLSIGKRVVTQDLHFTLEGVTPAGVTYSRNVDKVWSKPDESLIILTGDIEMGDREYWLAKPYITNFSQLLPGLPAGCKVGGGSYPQSYGHKRGFKLMIVFRELNDKPECGTYFRNLKTLTLNMTDLWVEWTKYGGFKKVAAANPTPITINLPPIQAKNPQPPD